jgi:hypothetical protein
VSSIDAWPQEDPVLRARNADFLMWSVPERSAEFRRARDSAVREAALAGVPTDQLAAALGVRPSDVERMREAPLREPGLAVKPHV